jgi:hypothetical protein
MRTKFERLETAIRASQDKMSSYQNAVKSYQQNAKVLIYNLHENIEDAKEEVNAIVYAI